jgi:hypothetical protein
MTDCVIHDSKCKTVACDMSADGIAQAGHSQMGLHGPRADGIAWAEHRREWTHWWSMVNMPAHHPKLYLWFNPRKAELWCSWSTIEIRLQWDVNRIPQKTQTKYYPTADTVTPSTDWGHEKTYVRSRKNWFSNFPDMLTFILFYI